MANKLFSDGIWTWFNTPSAFVDGDSLYVGAWIAAGNRPCVARYDLVGKSDLIVGQPSGAAAYEDDDHDNPGIIRLTSGRLLACWSYHNGDSFYATTTATDGDIRTWNAAVTVQTAEDQSYAQVWQTDDDDDTIWWMYRKQESTPTTYRSTYLRSGTEEDGVITWGSGSLFMSEADNRPYLRFFQTSGSRVDFWTTEGHPDEYASALSIYHGYLIFNSDATWDAYQSDGTLVGDESSGGFNPGDFTKVNTTSSECYIHDGRVIDGTPVCTYAVSPNITDKVTQEYYRAVWNGSSWDEEKVADAGTTAAADYLYVGAEDYTAHTCIDPLDADIIYLSREYDTADFRMEKWERDGTWSKTADLSGDTGTVNARPVAAAHGNTTYVVWWEGIYTSYTSYLADIRVYPDHNFRTAKPSTPELNAQYTFPASQIYLPFQDGSGSPTDILTNYTPANVGTPTWGSESFGAKLGGFSTSNYVTANSLAAAWLAGGYPKWMAVQFEHSAEPTTSQLVFALGSSSDNGPLIGLNINQGGVAGTVAYFLRGDSGGALEDLAATSVACNDGAKHVAMLVSSNSSTNVLFYDGANVAANGADSFPTATCDRFAIGCLLRATPSIPFLGDVYAFAAGWAGYPRFQDVNEDWSTGRFSGINGVVAVTPVNLFTGCRGAYPVLGT